jgi:opacity protein-like surface antigen
MITGFLLAATVLAQGLYIGAGIGNSFFSSDVQDATDQITEIDENSTAWKIFGGLHGPRIIGVEGGYRDFGKVESTVSGESFESKTTGWDIEALGRIEITIVDIFAKAGILFLNTDFQAGNEGGDNNDTAFLWGIGAGVHLGPLGARLEWESAETDNVDNLSMVTLSATFGF